VDELLISLYAPLKIRNFTDMVKVESDLFLISFITRCLESYIWSWINSMEIHS
jgi:hypothetical protein